MTSCLRRLGTLALVLTLSVPALGDGFDRETLLELAREYNVETGRRGKDEVLAKIAELGPYPDKESKKLLKEVFKIARSGPKSDGKGECVAKWEKFPGIYYLSGAGGGKRGIVLGLHGGGPGVGDGRSAQSTWGGGGKGMIGIFPTANLPDQPTTWQSSKVEGFVIAALKELKRTFRIDTNRIYCVGHSLGGSGAYYIGLRHADWFAGVSPNAGGCRGIRQGGGVSVLPGGTVANLYNTPILITHYDQDPRVGVEDSRAAAKELAELKKEHPGGYEFKYVEGQGKSHGFPPKYGPSQILAWLKQNKRDPYPKKVIWEPASPEKRLFFWLRKARPVATSSRGTRIVAEIRGNEITVETKQARGVSILLADEMFDPKRPVKVVLNGEVKFEGKLERSAVALVESILENIDPEQVFEYRIDLEP